VKRNDQVGVAHGLDNGDSDGAVDVVASAKFSVRLVAADMEVGDTAIAAA
jgi:hypothetical protein